MNKYKVAIIGLGHQATEDHLPGIIASAEAELVAVCDTNKDRLKQVVDQFKVRGYDSCGSLFSNEKLDFVIIATPHVTHLDIIRRAVQSGVHILKEKPLANNLSQAKEIKSLCEKNNLHLMVTLQRRFNPIYTTFFELLDHIGKVHFVEMKYGIFVKEPHNGWRGDKNISGGGCIIDMGYHMIDMLIWYFGLPNSVSTEFNSVQTEDSFVEVEDCASIVFAYDEGLHGSLILSRYYSPKTEYIKIIGDRGSIEIKRGQIVLLKPNGEVVESLVREHSWPTAFSSQVDYFCKVLAGKKENIGSIDKHLEHMAFIEACYNSKLEGRKINPHSLI